MHLKLSNSVYLILIFLFTHNKYKRSKLTIEFCELKYSCDINMQLLNMEYLNRIFYNHIEDMLRNLKYMLEFSWNRWNRYGIPGIDHCSSVCCIEIHIILYNAVQYNSGNL